MLETDDERILKYVQDYRLNLIEPYGCSDEELESLQSSLREVMLFIKYSKDKQKLRRLLQEDDRYTRMDKRAALVINAATNMKIKVDSDQNGKEEAVDMCQAVAEMMEDARNEAREEMCQAIAEMMEDARNEAREEMRQAVAEMMEDARNEGREEMRQAAAEMMEDARNEGREEMCQAVAKKLINRGGFTSEEISELSGLPEEEVEKIIKNA
jgi:nucleotide-binding universal stress UspA family protein